MSFTHGVIGASAIGLAIAGIGAIFLPKPPPIQVASISYRNGEIIEDHTVASNLPEIYLRRSAELRDARTGEVVAGCTGATDGNFLTGNFERRYSLPEWIGNDGCVAADLPPGSYIPVAIYVSAQGQMLARGETFVIGSGQ